MSTEFIKGHVAYNFRQIKLKHPPVITSIEISNKCNYKCFFCPINSQDKTVNINKIQRPQMFMPLNHFKELVYRYHKYIFNMDISNHGEPLLHPDFYEVVDYIKQMGLKYHVITNGSLIRKRKDDLCERPPESITFSLYTTNAEHYKKLTGGVGNLPKVLWGIKDFISAKEKWGLKTKIIIRSVDYPEIIGDRDSLIKEFKDFDVSFDFNVLNSWNKRIDVGRIDNKEKHVTKVNYCVQPWQHVRIGSNGDVFACCNHGDNPMGNVWEDSLEDIWNNPKYLLMREHIINGNIGQVPLCKNCDYFNDSTNVERPNPFFVLSPTYIRKGLETTGLIKRKTQEEYKKSNRT